MSQNNLSSVRREYLAAGLHEDNLVQDPFVQFSAWMDDALQVDPKDATSMTLATADEEGLPSARIVLLKGSDSTGFTWFTNYDSEKGGQIKSNPWAELLFYWPALERQVRIRGTVEKISRDESVRYFHSRPLGSQHSAAASQQSQPVESRSVLESKVAEFSKQSEVDCPENWGGYRLTPQRFEFWQGRASRLHDRFQFNVTDQGWTISRLQP